MMTHTSTETRSQKRPLERSTEQVNWSGSKNCLIQWQPDDDNELYELSNKVSEYITKLLTN